MKIKKVVSILAALVLVLGLTACFGGEKPSNDPAAKPTTASSDGGASSDDIGYNDAMQALNDVFGESNVGDEYYHFPTVANYEEWPDESVWASMGMINLKPAGCDTPTIYNDGQIYNPGLGMWNGFSAKCKCDDGAYEDTCRQVWDAGYRGMSFGNGVIADAPDFDTLMDEDEGYGAFYEHDGWVLYVEISRSAYDGSVYCAVYDALTMPEKYEPEYPSIEWPSAEKQGMPADMGYVGSALTGVWNDDPEAYYPEAHSVYAKNVTKEQFESYLSGLDDIDGLSYEYSYGSDDIWESYDVWCDADTSVTGTVSYCEAVQMVNWYWTTWD